MSHLESTGNHDEKIFWKAGDARPAELAVDPTLYSALPKCCAWISVDDDDNVALLEGYNICSHIPPTIMVSSSKFPPSMYNILKETKRCSVSVATVREQHCLSKAATLDGATPRSFTFQDLALVPCPNKTEMPGPPCVQSSPVRMHCTLINLVELDSQNALLLLEAELVLIGKEILSPPTARMKSSGRVVLAKIDAELLKPVGSLGHGKFVTLPRLHSMERPRATDADLTSWESDPFALVPASPGPDDQYQDIEYLYHNDTSGLGYNPMKEVILPRPIGWIGTYRYVADHGDDDGNRGDECQSETSRISHVAPYSFYTDLGSGFVAFSSYRKNYDGNDSKKDAQFDTETMGCFSTNVVTEDLAFRMNFTSAPLTRDESEFSASPGLSQDKALLIDAPIVKGCPIVTECRYKTTVDAASFSIVIGQIVGMHIDKRVLANGLIDPTRLCPVTRLGYTDEYGVANQPV